MLEINKIYNMDCMKCVLNNENYILLNEKAAKEYCARNCKNDEEKRIVKAAVHISFNSMYGHQKEPISYLPVKYEDYVKYINEKFEKDKK